MMKKYFLAAAALAALMTSATAQTSTRSFYDNRGSLPVDSVEWAVMDARQHDEL